MPASLWPSFVFTAELRSTHIVSVLLGGDVRLFANLHDQRYSLECIRVVESDGVTHFRYRVLY